MVDTYNLYTQELEDRTSEFQNPETQDAWSFFFLILIQLTQSVALKAHL
ncbi:hypothetical protein T11_15253 [Trichinella zimbabwensis]|uniref:Uncharacterized protein n=1 Tax=Trichinella zimbabwensis TaxID=268475 RepID=A0A0V1G6Z6_9BILA|nr:hypothetical protein T11_15253 [Trichinella zimbabwensis]